MPTHVEPATASVTDTVRVAAQVLLPTLAGGVIKRRPAVLAVAEKLQLDRPSVHLMGRLRARYGARPLKLRVPGRSVELALSGEDVGEVLAAAPTPFSPSSLEKQAALSHFQPHGVLVTDPEDRRPRRRFNEAVLEPGHPLHELAAPFAQVIADEAGELLAAVTRDGTLDWPAFNAAWWRMVRRIVFGSRAREDTDLTRLLDRLRFDANWGYLHPQRKNLRERVHRRVVEYLGLAEPGSLAASIAEFGGGDREIDPADQVAHWLFAFDAAGMVTFRALALLAGHPGAAERVRAELEDVELAEPQQLEYLRACVLESVRLWPTTPALLRESTTETDWGPAGTTVLIFTPFFHRDPDLPYADRFDPDIWLDGRAAANPALVPFSAGPAICPGRDLVLFSTSTLLAHLLRNHRYQLTSGPVLAPERPLPATLDNFHLKFTALPG